MRLKQGHVLAAGCVVLFSIAVLLVVLENYSNTGDTKEKMTIGVLLQGGFDEPGWNHRNYKGMQEAAGTLGLLLDAHENVRGNSEDAAQTITQLEAAKRKLVVLSSADYAADMQRARERDSSLVFAIPSLEQQPDEQCIPYFIRLYQGEYLAGILAGLHTKQGRIGYVASMPVPETVRGINAFTMGARRVNPQAEVTVYWVGSWDDVDKETLAAWTLIDTVGVDVINSHQDRPYVQQVAEQRGVDYFAYQDPILGASSHDLAMLACDWSIVYQEILQDYQQGQLRDLYWAGITEGAVDLSDYSSAVRDDEKQLIEQAKQEIRDGHTVFSGLIRDNQGRVRCAQDESISDAVLTQLDWFVEGVRIYE